MDERDRGTTRREILGMVAALPLVGCASATPADDDDDTPAGPSPLPDDPVEVGTVDSIPPSSLAIVPGQPLAIGRDDAGLWALGTVCTHLGCNIANAGLGGDISFARIACGCHGSQYGRDGEVLVGPSNRDLPNYRVVVEADGRVFIDATQEVALGTRVTIV